MINSSEAASNNLPCLTQLTQITFRSPFEYCVVRDLRLSPTASPALKENNYVQQDDMATFTEQPFYGGAIQGIIPEGWVDGRLVYHTFLLFNRHPS